MRQLVFANILFWIQASRTDAEPERIETDVGVYEVVRLPGVTNEFELTASREFGVQAGEFPSGGRLFESFSAHQPDGTLAEREVAEAHSWAIMGEEVYVESGV